MTLSEKCSPAKQQQSSMWVWGDQSGRTEDKDVYRLVLGMNYSTAWFCSDYEDLLDEDRDRGQ